MRRHWERAAPYLLAAAVLLYIVLFSTLSVRRYETFHAATFDLGYFSQVVWNTAQGRWFETSISRSLQDELVGSYLGEHATPILVLFAPLYRVWPDPRLLLVLQSAALGLAAVPLYALTRRVSDSATVALTVAVSYLLYPALGFLNLFDVHPIALSIPAVLAAAWALEERRWAVFWAGVALALLTKEEMVIPLGAWGMLNLLRRDKRRIGLGLLILAAAWAAISFGAVIPAFNEGQPYRFLQLWPDLPRLGGVSTQGGVAQATAEASPEAIALFLIHLILPLGFLPFLGPAKLIVALPSLAYLLLGRRAAFHSVGYQYPAVLIPWFFLAAVAGLGSLQSETWPRGSRLRRLGLAALLIGTLGTNVVLNPVLLHAQAGFFRRDPYHDQIVEALSRIPPDAGVAAVNRLGPQLANRRVLVALDYPPPLRLDHVAQADYVLFDLVDCRTVAAADQRGAYADLVGQVLETGLYRVSFWSGRILLLEKGEPSSGELKEILNYVAGLVEQDRPCWP